MLLLVCKRPSDDGGSNYLYGSTKICRVKGDVKTQQGGDADVKLYDCDNRNSLLLGNKSEEIVRFYNLKCNTRYYFSAYLESSKRQKGQEASLFYTTPCYGKALSTPTEF